MGCILACLRFKDSSKKRNKAQLKSSPVPPKTKEPLLSEDKFVSVFISEGSTCKQVADLNFEDNRDKDVFNSELKDEVKILNSCGAFLETPVESWKASEKLIAQPLNKDISSSDSSCIPDTLIKKLVWEEQQEDSEFSQNSVAGSKFGEHQSRRHNDCTSKTASCVAHTRKFAFDEEQEDSSFEQHGSEGFIFGIHQAQKHNECASSSASQRESACLESGSESAVSDVSPSHGDTTDSVCFQSAKLDPKIESSAESAVLDVSASRDDTKGSVCFGSAKHDPKIESSVESCVLDLSASRDDSEGSVCFGSAKHDPEIVSTADSAVLDVSASHESSAESAATMDASPSPNGTQIQVHCLKDACLESVTYNPGSESGDSPSQDGTQIQALGGKNSPYPTPLELTDEMGTPCTVYPSTRENLRRKNDRVRNQYVYPVLTPAENLPRLKVQQTPVTSSSDNQNDKRNPDSNEFDKENYSSVKKLRSLTPLSNSRWKVNLESPQVEVLSLSQWLKHPPRDNNKKHSCFERTPDVERPIFGVVALHWNEDDPSKISPKLWGGNGIPNTTTKYKEDQKVSWHATPFEERLDKALSDDKLFPRRKEISRNLAAFEDEGELMSS